MPLISNTLAGLYHLAGSKPVDFDRFIGVIGQIDEFFLTLVKLPRPPG